MGETNVLSFGNMSTHPNGQKVDNNRYQHNNVQAQNTPIRSYKEVNSIENKHNDTNANKPPSKLLMPLHIASLAAYDDALLQKHIIKKLCRCVKTTKIQ